MMVIGGQYSSTTSFSEHSCRYSLTGHAIYSRGKRPHKKTNNPTSADGVSVPALELSYKHSDQLDKLTCVRPGTDKVQRSSSRVESKYVCCRFNTAKTSPIKTSKAITILEP